MKYLIVGLGNIGDEYKNTRHNIGFKILDTFAEVSNIVFAEQRYGSVAECRLKGQTLILLKPSTFMNLSGNALRYWLQKENIALENLLVLVDDLALPFGTLRLKGNGSDAGHNGLKNIQEILGHNNYARLRFGIGSNFSRGRQIDYVLGEWTAEECEKLPERIDVAVEMVKTFCLAGIQTAMNLYNNANRGLRSERGQV